MKMNFVRCFASNPFVSLTLCGIFLFASCSKTETDNKHAENVNSEKIFREIMLMQGENIEQKIPEYAEVSEIMNSLTSEQRRDREIFCKEIIDGINKIDPAYFDHFKTIMKSGDVYLIDNELISAAKLINQSLLISELYGDQAEIAIRTVDEEASKYDLTKEEQVNKFVENVKLKISTSEDELRIKSSADQYRGACVATAVGATVAVYVFAVAGETLAVANMLAVASVFVYAKGKFWGPKTAINSGITGSLSNAQIVSSISKSYN